MKKLLYVLVLGLFSFKSVSANTDVEDFVFEKLFDEYSHCTVYYKFLARSGERTGELKNDDKLFVDEMNQLSEKSETNMFFFAKKMSIPTEDVQKNIQKIYESFLNIAGRDYSKTEILINRYTKSCENSLADPKARMVYWDIQFQKKGDKTSEETANSLLGVKLGDRTLNYETSGKKGYYDSEIIFDRYIYTKNTNKFFDNIAYVKFNRKGTIVFIGLSAYKTKTSFESEKECEELINKISNIKSNQFINNGYKKSYTPTYPKLEGAHENVEKWRKENKADEILNDGRWNPIAKRWTMIDIMFEKFDNNEIKKSISYRAYCTGVNKLTPSLRISDVLELTSLSKLYNKEKAEKKLKKEKEESEKKLKKEKQLDKDTKQGFE